ncbi:right-handed parallel beta-helix repeat-containing protein [Defluviimonas sp. SAOS-178_SWC]|uniref:right-handed parallel beta-helix repeat-containing protein n=1 Tax=Defluviimonas sp. SAOS-178_SWC TaxID=3121287 RepID=UPI00322167EF
MADVGRSLAVIGKSTVAAGLGLFLFAASAMAAPDWKLMDLRTKLAALSTTLGTDEASRDVPVRDLVAGLDGNVLRHRRESTTAYSEPDAPATIGWTDSRFAVAALSQVYGGQNNLAVFQASSGNGTDAIHIDSGVVTLRQLRGQMTNRYVGRDIDTGADLLRIPLIIGEKATLRLTPGETLMLSRRDGAFIVSFGRIEAYGAEISATAEPSEANKDFSPFIASVGSGSVHLSGATLKYLGFGNTEKFSGLSIVAYPTMRPANRTVIENTRFEDMVTLALVGVTDAELHDNRFFDMRRNPLLLSHAPHSIVAGNLFSGSSPTNAIRVSNGSGGTEVTGNIILEGSRAGMLISSGSDNVSVTGNLIWRRNGGGVKLLDVTCGRVERNVILDDKQKGVEVRNSRDAFVHANKIIGNKNAGVWVSGQTKGEVTYITDNLLRENGSGLTTAAGAAIALKGNDLSNQFPRLLDGDVTQQFRSIIADLRGQTPILLDAGGASPTDILAPTECAL